MLKFNCLFDGDCLYSSVGVGLIYAFQRGQLSTLFDGEVKKNFVSLLEKIGELNADIKPTLTAAFSQHRIHAKNTQGYKALIKSFCNEERMENHIDWVKLQQVMAEGLRAVVIDAMKNDKKIRQEVINELQRLVDLEIEAYTEEEIESIHAEEFKGIEAIANKIIEIRRERNEDLSKEELMLKQKEALTDWFFNDEAVGLAIYLKAISKKGVYAGALEAKVFSKYFNIAIQYYSEIKSAPQKPQVFWGFKTTQPDRSDLVIFNLEHIRKEDHWNVLLSDTPTAHRIIYIYKSQFDAFEKKQKMEKLKGFIAEYGSYQRHCQLLSLSPKEYCFINELSEAEFEQNLLPGQMPKKREIERHATQSKYYRWVYFATILFIILGAMSVAHFGIWPMLSPLLNKVFAGSIFKGYLSGLMKSITVVYGLGMGWIGNEIALALATVLKTFMDDTLAKKNEKEQSSETQINENEDALDASPSLLPAYERSQSQSDEISPPAIQDRGSRSRRRHSQSPL